MSGKGKGKGKGKAKGSKRKRPLLAEYRKTNAKKARGKVVEGSQLIHPKHNQTVNKQQLKDFLYDPVAPELEVACRRVLNAMGSARGPLATTIDLGNVRSARTTNRDAKTDSAGERTAL